MTLEPVRVMGAGVVVTVYVEEVRTHIHSDKHTLNSLCKLLSL